MIDVNGLKLVNDAFGHNLGDQLLHAAGQTISDHSRADDIVCRIGGDEFVFILPQTDEAGTETVVNRLRKACRDVRLGPFQLSFSLGWATRNSMDMSTRDLLQQAEEWMY
jgi:diguanylate cyclase (GGDEF)-like protein